MSITKEDKKVRLEDLITREELNKSVDVYGDSSSRFMDKKSLYNLTKKELDDLKIRVSQSKDRF